MDIVTLAAARRLIYNAIAGLDGPIAGKNCKIQSVEDITGGHRITFSWSDDEDVARTTTVDVMDGNNIEEVEVKYASSQSGTTPPVSGWGDDVPSVPDGYYLWTRNTVTFSNGDTNIEYLVGRQGVDGYSPVVTVTDISGGHKVRITDERGNHDFNVMDGLAIDFIDVDYAESSSGTSAPLVGWQSNPPEVATGNYLWTRNTTHLMDGTTSVAYMVGLQGAAGVSPDVETTPVSGGTQVVITDKDGPHSFTVLNGIDGADGQDGAAGADGFSPIITTDKVGKTTTITIVDAAGTKYATVLDGVDGKTITNITINAQNHVIVSYSDGTSSDAGELIVQSAVMSVNGQTGDVELELPDVVNVGANLTYDSQTNTLSADAQSIDVDSEISSTSENPVQNKVIKSALDDKVDKVSGKGLSTNDYTTAEKNKLSGIASGAEVNVQSDWNQTDTTADDYIKNKPTLGTAAAKDSTNSVTENSTDLVESGAVKTAIDSAISRVYKPAGNKTCAQLTSALLVKANLGNVYNITDSGTTTSDFVEGAGKTIELGDNVAVVDVGTSSSPSYKFDLLSGMVDLSNYVQKSQTSGLLKNDGTVDSTRYMSKSNPTGTGSFSLNRKANSTIGNYSFAEGYNTEASGLESHAEGAFTEAIGSSSHSEGIYTLAKGFHSHAEGYATEARGENSHVQGKYNVVDTSVTIQNPKGTYADIIGNGTADDNRKNIEATTWTGDKRLKGTVYVNCNDDSTGGTDLNAVKADKVLNATNGNFAGLDSNGNITDSGKKASDFIISSDLSDYIQKSQTNGLVKNDGTIDTTSYAKQSEMSVTNGTGTDADKVTIQLKSGTSATVLKTHQDISGKVDKVSGKGLSTNDYTTTEKDKLAGIATGAEVNVQSNWTQTDTSKDDFIKNKPTLGTAAAKNIPASGNAGSTEVVMGNDTRLSNARTPTSHTHTKSEITDFPTLATVATSGSYNDLTNKPTIPAAQVNSNWNATSGVAQILNKPTLGTAAAKDVPSSGNASTTQVVMGNDTRLSDARTPTSHTHSTSDITGYADTKNTAGGDDTSSKIYPVGVTAQTSSNGNARTYTDNEFYVTSGVLTTKKVQVGGGSGTMQYNATTEAIEFVF